MTPPTKVPRIHHLLAAATAAALALGACSIDESDPGDELDPIAIACEPLTPIGVSASGHDGNVPGNVLDGSLTTRWSSFGKGQSITLDLGAEKTVCSAQIAWYNGASRRNRFTVALSGDGVSFERVYSGRSSGRSAAIESYEFADASARYVRVVVNGNTANDWASITELRAVGGADGGGGGGGGGDTTAPVIAITAPTAGVSVSGTVSVSGSASDDSGLARVEVQIDGGPFAAASGTTAWSFAWNTSGLAAGTHTVTARATDVAGNRTAASTSVTIAGAGGQPVACDRNATSAATLTSEFATASAGQTICLASGSYGAFRAGTKSGLVTVRAASGATASMSLDFNAVTNVRVEGVTITGGRLGGASRDVTVARSKFTGLFVIEGAQLVNARIVFDGNTHADINTCTTCVAARLHIDGNNGQPSGIVIKNSVFSGGNSDGIRPDVDGVQILDNEFFGMVDQDPFHTDPIQLYGGTRTVIRGNYFHDNRTASHIMMADGGRGNVVENNVFGPSGGWAITWYSDNASTIRHNTFVNGTCAFGRCGIPSIGAKPGASPGVGTIFVDNIVTQIGTDNNATLGARHHNLVPSAPAAGDLLGTPSFVGGANPSTYAGYRLAAGSPGKGQASDGGDIGIP